MKARVFVFALLLLTVASSCWAQVADFEPELQYSNPYDGYLTNDRNQTVQLKFDMVVTNEGVIVAGPAGNVPVTTAYGADQSILVVTPTQVLADGVYVVDFSGVRGGQGYPVTGTTAVTFTVDATPPQVVASTPMAVQTGVPVDTQISVTFSEALAEGDYPAPFRLIGPLGDIQLEPISMNPNTHTYVYMPVSPLEMATTYTVDYSIAADLAWNFPAPPASFTFTTAAPEPLVLQTSSPANGETGVSLAEQVVLTFNTDLNPQTSQLAVSAGGIAVPGTLLISGATATFVPSSPYSFGTVYTVQFSGIRDIYEQAPTGPTTISFTTIPPDPLTLVGSSPTNGESGVSTSAPIVLTFSNDVDALASSVTVSGGGLTVPGVFSAVGPTATFTPSKPYASGVLYSVQFAGVKDIYGQSLTGLTQITFSVEGAVLDGRVDPPVVTLAAGERVGVTYLIRNLSGGSVNVQSSTAEYYVNDALVASVTVPAEAEVAGNATAALACDAAISELIQSAARDAGTEEIVMLRTFSSVGENGSSVTVPLVIRVGSSLGGPPSVTEIVLDVPPDSKTVGQFDEIRGHAFIRGTGTGAVVGTWFVDSQPMETFQINLTAGITQEVWTRLTLPTLDLGEHQVELRIARPQSVSSGERRYVVVPKGAGSQRVFVISPTNWTILQDGGAKSTFRWAPMPGSSGYEIAISPTVAALGLDENGELLGGPIDKLAWNRAMVDSGELSLLARVTSDVVAWTPSEEDYDKLFAQDPGVRYWAVRAVYPWSAGGDPTTTSRPRHLKLQAASAEMTLTSPGEGEVVTAEEPLFSWNSVSGDVIYEFSVFSGDQRVFSALTRSTEYRIGVLSPFRLPAGVHSWRVSALSPTDGIVATSAKKTFVIKSEFGAVAPSARPQYAAGAQTVTITPAGIGLLPGAAEQITLTPPNGSVVASQQPVISAAYPQAKPFGVSISLNGVDVTAIAVVTPTKLTLQPPGVFSEGDHTVSVVVTTDSGAQLTETSTFTIAVAKGTDPEAATAGVADTAQPTAAKPLQLDFNWNWRSTTDGTTGDDFAIDLNFVGQQTWVWRGGSYAAFNFQLAKPGGYKVDLASFVAETSVQEGKFKALLGDIGTAESELTAQGVMARAFSFVSNAGPVRFSASRTLGRSIQRSSIGRAPDMLLVTAENAGATAKRGIKFTYVDSESDLSGSSSFGGPSKSKVVSIGGRTPLGRTGLNLRSELADSNNDAISTFGAQSSSGRAFTATVDGVVAGFGVATTYRRVGSEYASQASSTLTSDLKGWALAVNRPIGKFVNTTLNYSDYNNLSNSITPESSLVSRSLDVAVNYPGLPSLTLRLGRNDASSAPFVEGGRPGDTEETMWSVTANYGGPRLNGYLTYSKSDFDDFFDFINPDTDTPNDRATGTWSFGLGMQPMKAFKLRVDWGANGTDRWLRPLLGLPPLLGSDRSRQGRIHAEYLISPRVSATMAWSNSDYSAALGAYRSEFRNFNARLNYFLRLTPGGGGLALTGEYRRYKTGGTLQPESKDLFSILINDNRLVSF